MVEERKDKSPGGELKKVAFVMDQKNHTVQWGGSYADVFINSGLFVWSVIFMKRNHGK